MRYSIAVNKRAIFERRCLGALCVYRVRHGARAGSVSGAPIFSPTHKRTEGRAPVWGSEFTSKRRRTTGGIQEKPM